MSDVQSGRRRWIGRSIVGISVIHTIFALAVYGQLLAELLHDGLFDSLGGDTMRAAFTWFVFAGFFMFTTGLGVDALEKNRLHGSLVLPGWALLAITILGIVMMPVSGFWLMLPPAIAMIVIGKRRQDAT